VPACQAADIWSVGAPCRLKAVLDYSCCCMGPTISCWMPVTANCAKNCMPLSIVTHAVQTLYSMFSSLIISFSHTEQDPHIMRQSLCQRNGSAQHMLRAGIWQKKHVEILMLCVKHLCMAFSCRGSIATCDNVGQSWIKVLQQVQYALHKEQGVIMTIKHPLIASFKRL